MYKILFKFGLNNWWGEFLFNTNEYNVGSELERGPFNLHPHSNNHIHTREYQYKSNNCQYLLLFSFFHWYNARCLQSISFLIAPSLSLSLSSKKKKSISACVCASQCNTNFHGAPVPQSIITTVYCLVYDTETEELALEIFYLSTHTRIDI